MGISKRISVFVLVLIMGTIGILTVEPRQSGAESEALYGVNSSVDGLFSIKKTKSINVSARCLRGLDWQPKDIK